jgi:thiamine pyrophosphate-dependent acetolactate synthase large subunit-like protein
MLLGEAFKWLDDHRSGQLVVTPAGSGTRAWYQVTEDRESTFYLNASMGMVSMFSFGLAAAVPEATVWAIAGDGGLAMNPSCFATEAEYLPANLRHIVIMNRVFGVTGKIPLPNGGGYDFTKVAEGFGIPIERCYEADSLEALDRIAHVFSDDHGYGFVVLRIEVEKGLVEPASLDGAELKYRFGRAMERRFGVQVFDERGV